jgi:arsenical pump membrane protein
VTVIVVTPIVYALTQRLEIEPLPYLFACAFVANTASLFLPISNLTNILIYDLLHLSFVQFAAVMFLPNLAALAVNVGIFFVIFRGQLPGRFATTALTDDAPPSGFAIAAIGLALVLAALLAFGLLALPLAIPACIGAAVLVILAAAQHRMTRRDVVGSVSWSLFPFVIAMFTVMRGLERAWLPHLHTMPTGHGLGTLLAIAFGTGVGANVVNNVPMIAAMITLLRAVATPVPEHLAFATLIGTNIGPSVLTFGSLATMLWLALVRKRGVEVSARAYLRIGLLTTPPMLLAATVTLWLVLRGSNGIVATAASGLPSRMMNWKDESVTTQGSAGINCWPNGRDGSKAGVGREAAAADSEIYARRDVNEGLVGIMWPMQSCGSCRHFLSGTQQAI